MADPNSSVAYYQPPVLGFDQRWAPVIQLLQRQAQQQAQAQPDTDINTYNDSNLPMWKRVGLQAPPVSGPQQSYANRSESAMPAGPGGGASGQVLQQTSSYNNSPYSSGPQGTIGNTGAPLAQSGSQVVSQGGRGLDQYQSTPSWTGSPLSQSPPARDEGDFNAPPINGPAPLRQRQQVQAMLEALKAHYQNLPRPYHFKLG